MKASVQEKNRITELYPLTKFYLALVLCMFGMMLPGIIAKAACFVVINVLAAVSGVYSVFLKRTKNSVGMLLLLLLVIQTFFYPGETVLFTVWVFSAKLEGVLFALNLGTAICNVGGCLIWFFAVTTERDFVLALEKKGMGGKASYVVLSTLQMVPVLKKRSQVIMNAQQARGVETEGNLLVRLKVFAPTLIPLVLSSIQGIEERALTLEARGFSIKSEATHLYDIQDSPIDKKVNIGTTILLIAGIVGRIVLWVI